MKVYTSINIYLLNYFTTLGYVLGKHDKKKSKSICTKHVLNCDLDTVKGKGTQSSMIPVAELKIRT